MPYLIIIKCGQQCGFKKTIVPNTKLIRSDPCIIHTSKGQSFGYVVKNPTEIEKNSTVKESCKLLRKAAPNDIKQHEENKELENKALQISKEKAAQRKLPMKLVQVKYTFDRSRATFYFTAEGRIDFRELVKDLAYELRVRIEMKQIGVRDEAKLLGGYGCCGQPLCCASFLENFEPVSIRMAKVQNLTLDPSKISGVCGRLMCCLGYEYSTYEEKRKRLPKLGEKVLLDGEKGKIKSIDILKEIIRVELSGSRIVETTADKITRKDKKKT